MSLNLNYLYTSLLFFFNGSVLQIGRIVHFQKKICIFDSIFHEPFCEAARLEQK